MSETREERVTDTVDAILDLYSLPYPDMSPAGLYEILDAFAEEEYTRGLRDAQPKTERKLGCGVCGGRLAIIRGKYVHDPEREVCPTCLADKMDLIREVCNPAYGRAYQAAPEQP